MTSKSLRLSRAIYRLVLYVYPREHRRVYGQEMARTFHDLCRAAVAERGNTALFRLWLDTLADTAFSATVEHLAILRKGMVMSRRSLLTLGLVLIFALFTGYVNVTASEVQAPMGCLLAFSFLAGFLQPKAAWRWGVLIGLSIPLSTFVALAINFHMIDVPRYPISLAVLVLPALIAAYGGAVVNRVVSTVRRETF